MPELRITSGWAQGPPLRLRETEYLLCRGKLVIKTRFSPSPTGFIHLGNVRAALFSALFAEKNQGTFLLRVEDTDQTRSAHEYTDALQQDLQWLGVHWQEGPGVEGPNGPYFQSKRANIYANYYQQLEQQAKAYPCFCTDHELALQRKIQLSRGKPPRYSGLCLKLTKEDVEKKLAQGLKPALRFRIPPKTMVEFVDLVKGPQKFNSEDIGDFIIRRADGSSSFMFCNAIDDSLMGVTHVIRGEDHLTNTPRQLMILNTLGLRAPHYGHLALITDDEGGKLSKRGGSFSLQDLRTQGFLSVAVLNYLARLGHTYDSQQLMSFKELALAFNLEKLSRSSARFDQNQLLFWQKQSVMSLSEELLWQWMGSDVKQQVPQLQQFIFLEIMKQNALFPKDASHWATILFDPNWTFSEDNINLIKQTGKDFFITWLSALQQHGSDIKKINEELKTKLNISGKNLFLPMRIVLSGEAHGPELVQIAALLGQQGMEKRIKNALKVLETSAC